MKFSTGSIEEIDDIIEYDEKGKHWTPWGKWGLIMKLRREQFDAAFLLHGSKTRALLASWAGISQRIGYDTKGRSKYLTKAISVPKESLHRADYYLRVIEESGIKVHDKTPELKISEEAKEEVKELLCRKGVAESESFIVINPGGNWNLKQWPKEKFIKLVRQLAQHDQRKMVISGAKKDEALAADIAEGLGEKVSVVAGETTLKQLMALMARADIVISADSGPLHLANSVGTKTIALFGPTRPEITGPRGSAKVGLLQHDVGCNRQACYYLECPDNVCMQAITVNEVEKAVKALE